MTRCYHWILLLVVVPAAAQPEVVVRHLPDQSNAWASDTDFTYLGFPYCRWLADDFRIDAPAAIRRVSWWGDYEGAAPPATETVCIRLYQTDAGSGLPGSLLSDSTVLNPLRKATGLSVRGPGGTSITYPEYSFEVDLAVPISLDSNTRYWLEISQLGDRTSTFRWEFSATDGNGFARVPASGAAWQSASPGDDLAFELCTMPEPGTFVSLVLGTCLARRRMQEVVP